jgi:O-antigen/teichoic acid export membrane protein
MGVLVSPIRSHQFVRSVRTGSPSRNGRLQVVQPREAGIHAQFCDRHRRVAYVAAGVISVALAVRALQRAGTEWEYDWAVAKDLLVFGVKSYAGSASSLFNERIDQLLVGVFLGTHDLGLYVVAVTLTSVTVLVGQSVALVALPTLAAIREPIARRVKGDRFAAITLIFSATVALLGVATARWLMPHLFGAQFGGAVECAQLLFVASIVLSLNRTLGSLLRADNKPGAVGIAEGLALAATVGMLALLVPRYGIIGAALASIIAYCVSMTLMCFLRWGRPVGAPQSSGQAATSP